MGAFQDDLNAIRANQLTSITAIGVALAAIIAVGVLISTFNTDFLARNNIDAVTTSRLIVMYEHHEVHASSSYITSNVVNVDTDTLYWMVITADTDLLSHMVFDIRATGELFIIITGGGDRTGVAGLSEVNRRQDGTLGIATTQVFQGITGGTTNGADTLEISRDGATGQGARTVGAAAGRGNTEYNLKRNTKYVIMAITFADVYVTLHLDWYEHIDEG